MSYPVPKPIDTAPKDGTTILVWNYYGWSLKYWVTHVNSQYSRWETCYQTEYDGSTEPDPTHWLPLPGPPEVTQ